MLISYLSCPWSRSFGLAVFFVFWWEYLIGKVIGSVIKSKVEFHRYSPVVHILSSKGANYWMFWAEIFPYLPCLIDSYS